MMLHGEKNNDEFYGGWLAKKKNILGTSSNLFYTLHLLHIFFGRAMTVAIFQTLMYLLIFDDKR